MRNASSVPFVGIAWLLSSILSGCAISLETSADRNPVDSRTPKADASALIAAQHKDFPQLDQTSAISDAVVEPSQPALAIRPAKQIATKTPPVIAIPPAVPNAVEAPADRGTRSSRVSNSQFVWEPEKAPRGPMVLVVSLADQQAYVYRNGVRIGQTNVSTGRAGY